MYAMVASLRLRDGVETQSSSAVRGRQLPLDIVTAPLRPPTQLSPSRAFPPVPARRPPGDGANARQPCRPRACGLAPDLLLLILSVLGPTAAGARLTQQAL